MRESKENTSRKQRGCPLFPKVSSDDTSLIPEMTLIERGVHLILRGRGCERKVFKKRKKMGFKVLTREVVLFYPSPLFLIQLFLYCSYDVLVYFDMIAIEEWKSVLQCSKSQCKVHRIRKDFSAFS
ncbi:hypothetical protein CEXT_401541 [Caerostris extrusa]|uniref:Uncharacterized protein n=1 Tax=Caerostris extrusa TaxID=172846 RepID=A0AAV4NJD0_CAEEX|nr:hypothetical protein CEXT_401541 [Caerostris extrusa]